MSSSDAYSSSSNGGESSEEEAPAARAPAGTHRGATPRGARTNARRNPKRYTTAEMDAEIAMYKEKYSDESSSSSEDDDEDASVEERKPAAKSKRGTPAKKASPRRRSGYKPPKPRPAKKKKKKPAKTSPAKGRKRPSKKDSFIADSDEEEEAASEESSDEASEEEYKEDASDASDGDENEDSDSDFGAPAKQRGRTKPSRKAKSPRARATPSRSTRAARATRAAYQEDSSDEEEEEEIEYDTTPTGTRRPRRHCKTQSEQKIKGMVARDMQSEREALGDMLEDDDKELLENSGGDDGSGSGSDEEVAPRGSGKRLAMQKAKKKSKYDDDDSYDEDAPDEEEEEEEEMSEYDEEEEDDLALPTRRSTRASPRKKAPPAYKDVDASDVGTAEEDSEDEAAGPSLLLSPARKGAAAVGSYGSPNVRQRARRGRTPLDVREEEGGSDDGESEEGRKRKPKRKRRKFSAGSSSDEEGDAGEARGTPRHALLKSPSSQINCPSTIDDITMAPLPTTKPHVCYVAPDGKTRHCFALDTLYRIAITSKAGDNPNISIGGKLQFLQPPHFRSPIEPDLEDQIASRFGRGALVIEKSAMYKKLKGLSVAGMDDELDDFDEDGEYVGHDAARSANFTDRFQRYMQSLMGSADVYCCPLCYNEADRRLGNNDPEMWEDDESDEEGNGTEDRHGSEDHFKFLDDPLTILGSLDAERLEVASSFCFRLMKDVKTHLKVVHGVKVSDVAGNDLYKRFQIRTGDGLLQSWLKKSLGHSTVQGDMMRYWLNGENQSFILLLDQIDRGRMRGEHSGEYGSAFSRSFPHRARRVWRDVSAPYLKDTQDMGDFIAEEGEEGSDDDEDGAVPVNPHFTPPGEKGEQKLSPMEEMIANLKKKNRAKGVFDNSDASLAEESDDSDVLEVLPRGPQHDEDEEEDEWTKSKSYKANKKKGKRSQDSDDDSVFDSDAEKPKPKTPTNGSARKVIGDGAGIDSEDEEESKPKAQMNGSARKRVIDSDEESY